MWSPKQEYYFSEDGQAVARLRCSREKFFTALTGGPVIDRLLILTLAKAVHTFPLPFAPRGIAVNDGGAVWRSDSRMNLFCSQKDLYGA